MIPSCTGAQLRKIIKTRGHFPSDDAASKLIWLALRNITADWSRASQDWKEAMNQFAILYEDRFIDKVHWNEIRLPDSAGEQFRLTHRNSDSPRPWNAKDCLCRPRQWAKKCYLRFGFSTCDWALP